MNKVLPLLFMLAFASCKKDNDTTALLTRSWQITAVTRKIETGVSIPVDISSCDNNKIWTFNKDGNFSTEPLPDCVSRGFVDVFNGTWILTGDEILKIEAQGGNGAMYLDVDIVRLTKSRLILRTWVTLDGREGVRGGGGGGFTGSQVITEFSAR